MIPCPNTETREGILRSTSERLGQTRKTGRNRRVNKCQCLSLKAKINLFYIIYFFLGNFSNLNIKLESMYVSITKTCLIRMRGSYCRKEEIRKSLPHIA